MDCVLLGIVFQRVGFRIRPDENIASLFRIRTCSDYQG